LTSTRRVSGLCPLYGSRGDPVKLPFTGLRVCTASCRARFTVMPTLTAMFRCSGFRPIWRANVNRWNGVRKRVIQISSTDYFLYPSVGSTRVRVKSYALIATNVTFSGCRCYIFSISETLVNGFLLLVYRLIVRVQHLMLCEIENIPVLDTTTV
jgi:hypothetical protein